MLFLSDIPNYAYCSIGGAPVTMYTDKREYYEEDTMIISGSVKSISADAPVTLEIFDPDKNLIHVAQVNLSQDGRFTYIIKIDGNLWKNFGSYIIRAQYGFHNISTNTVFDLLETVKPLKQTFQVDAGSRGSYDIPYVINGGKINDITIDHALLTLNLSINATKNGVIKLDIPRYIMDAKSVDGSDENFIILINDVEVNPLFEEDSSTFRNVTMNFLPDDSKIELIGTQIVPEFGSVCQLIFLTSIISGIVFTTTTFGRKILYQNKI